MAGDTAEAIYRLPNTFRRLGAQLLGYQLRGSKWVRRGEVIFADRTVMLHPLDLIALEHRGDPIGRSEAVAAYFTEQAHDQLDEMRELYTGAVEMICGVLVGDADAKLRALEGERERLARLERYGSGTNV